VPQRLPIVRLPVEFGEETAEADLAALRNPSQFEILKMTLTND
jgi:hypothetical protein